MLQKDDRGRYFYSQVYSELNKNHCSEDDDDNKDAIISAMPGDKDCPVYHITKYLLLRNKKCTALFQRPSQNVKDPRCWYDNMAVGKKLLEGYI